METPETAIAVATFALFAYLMGRVDTSEALGIFSFLVALILLFVAFELMSIPLFLLTGFMKRDAVDPRGFVWVVVGDAKTVRPQLAKLKMPIEVIEPR